MTYKLKLEGAVKGLGDVYYADAPFDEATKLFRQDGLELMSARDLAYARIQTGENSLFSGNGSWIREGVIYFPKQEDKIVLVRNSATLRNPVKATEARAQLEEFLLKKRTAKEYLKKVKTGDDSVYLAKDGRNIPTERFGEDELTTWLFQDQAENYGDFLNDSSVNEMPLMFDTSEHIRMQRKPYACQLLLGKLDDDSFLNGCGFINYHRRVRGVKISE